MRGVLLSILIGFCFGLFFFGKRVNTKVNQTPINTTKKHQRKEFSWLNKKNDTVEYFKEIALQAEYSTKSKRREHPIKFYNDINILIEGQTDNSSCKYVEKVIKELNQLITPVKLRILKSKRGANLFVFFGTEEEFISAYPVFKSKKNLRGTVGYCIVRSSNHKIQNLFVFVNTQKANTSNLLKHVIREEITQALGFPNDSEKYPTSIFYDKKSNVTEYSVLDKRLIEFLYNDK
jgi:hypothetical protein